MFTKVSVPTGCFSSTEDCNQLVDATSKSVVFIEYVGCLCRC